MNFFESISLGIVQGVTEFLPISSDGHLALGFKLMGQPYQLDFVVFLHFATLLAIIVYFWRDIVSLLAALLPANRHRRADRRLVLLIVIGTALSGALALGLEPIIGKVSESYTAIGLGFLLTAALLAAGEKLSKKAQAAVEAKRVDVDDAGDAEVEQAASRLPFSRAVLIGILQGIAALPGVSRSGSTIAAGMFSGLKREDAARFSFLLGIPIISLAAAKDGLDLLKGSAVLPAIPVSAAGFIASAVSGYLAIWGLLKLVRNHSLYWFAAYTGVLGTVILVMGLTGRG